jgi:hypothetical protein
LINAIGQLRQFTGRDGKDDATKIQELNELRVGDFKNPLLLEGTGINALSAISPSAPLRDACGHTLFQGKAIIIVVLHNILNVRHGLAIPVEIAARRLGFVPYVLMQRIVAL